VLGMYTPGVQEATYLGGTEGVHIHQGSLPEGYREAYTHQDNLPKRE